ncbi:glutamate synthase subunit beta [bacterium]|nr:glutamate synthase subunit beta [bacterium]
MGKPTGFIDYTRVNPKARPVEERLKDYKEIYPLLSETDLATQAARCMDCGIPFCHGAGCPVRNLIPEFNDLVFRGQWREALEVLHSTNNFPEFTGKICPAPCETACVAAVNTDAVAIKQIELQIIEKGFENGWVKAQPPQVRTGKRVAVVGSGPSGLACAQQLNRAGHTVVVYEQKDRVGGLLRYGIPDFKLDKHLLDRRVGLLQEEGIEFRTSVHIGRDIAATYLARQYDAVCLTGGAMHPRDLEVPGRELAGVHFAMEFLEQSNRRVAGDSLAAESQILAAGKHVIVIGGGDTGADCVGTSNRQGALSVTQLEILPRPPENSNPSTPWPRWPNILRSSTSHAEGCQRMWSVTTKSLEGEDGRVKVLKGMEVTWGGSAGAFRPSDKPGSEFELKADLVLLAMGFVHPVHSGMIEELGLELDKRGNVATDENLMSSRAGVFGAGDMVMGASLVVRAIYQGRKAAQGIDRWLMGSTSLP